MNSSEKSSLIRNITRYGLDARIGKMLLSIEATGLHMGEHVSRVAGYSPVVLDYRHYRAGDPIKDIDWKLSARSEKLFVKIRESYRQTDFVIAVDSSPSMKVSYDDKPSKYIAGLTIAYIAARMALKSRDRVAVMWKNERVSVTSEQSLIDFLLSIEQDGSEGDFWGSHIDAGANIFIISDFFIDLETFNRYVKGVASISDNVYACMVQDPVERELDVDGRYRFLDPESDAWLLAETRDFSREYRAAYHDHFAALGSRFKSFGIRAGTIDTDSDPFHSFIRIVS